MDVIRALGEYERGGKLSFRRRFCLQKPLTHFAKKAQMRSVSQSLDTFTCATLPRLLGAAVVISLLPLPRDYVPGNAGEAIFALLACPPDRDGPGQCELVCALYRHVALPQSPTRPRKVCEKPHSYAQRSNHNDQEESRRRHAQKHRPLDASRPLPRRPFPPLANRLSRLLGSSPRNMHDIHPRTTTWRCADPASAQHPEPAFPHRALSPAQRTTYPAPAPSPHSTNSTGSMGAHAHHGRRGRRHRSCRP